MATREGAEHACAVPNPVVDGRKANVNLAYLGAKPKNHSQPSKDYRYTVSNLQYSRKYFSMTLKLVYKGHVVYCLLVLSQTEVIAMLLEATARLLTFLMPTLMVYSVLTWMKVLMCMILDLTLFYNHPTATPLDLASVAAVSDSPANISALFQQL